MRYGFYFYFSNGLFKLDPTHVKEYTSTKEFINFFKNTGFKIISLHSNQITFSIIELFIRLFVKFKLLKMNTPNFINKKLFKTLKN